MGETFLNPLAEWVWRTRYRHATRNMAERDAADTMSRVARALARAEREPGAWTRRFARILDGFRFLPGGRILAAAGVPGDATLLNCFVMGRLDDAPLRLFRALGEGAHTLRAGGGVGWDFSTLAPRGTPLGRGRLAPGPVACLALLDAACDAVTALSPRGGAMMASLSAAHPDVAAFVEAKAGPGVLPRFNLSVQVPDGFMAALRADAAWPLSAWSGPDAGVPATPARILWERLLHAMLATSEPGLLFVDTINRENNLWWRERLTTTNPCGETPLPAYGACDLGSLNLATFVRDPFGPQASLDLGALRRAASTAVRLLDDVLDVTGFPLPRQRREALATRRIGLGITGLGDALAKLGLRYDSEDGRAAAVRALESVKLAAYGASARLAAEKGAFPAWDRDRYLAGAFASRLPGRLRDRIAASGLRNSHLLAIAPTGSVSLLAGNVSPGIEPIPALEQRRRLGTEDGEVELRVADRAWAEFCALGRGAAAGAFVEAADVSPEAQLAMQAALQPHVDGAISKTLLVPAGTDAGRLGALLQRAHRDGLKGIAVHRPGSVRGSALLSGCALTPPDHAACEPS
jgi:ribonucleoside-diphosphate reductase alpha chain